MTAEERIYRAVMRIPRGRVATYGQIARVAGMPRHHRQVGRALRQLVDDGLVPWHRVVGASGAISLRSPDGSVETTQRELLEEEGVVFDAWGRVPLARFQWARERQAPASPGAPRVSRAAGRSGTAPPGRRPRAATRRSR